MKKFLIVIMLALVSAISNAQSFNRVYPIINGTVKDAPVFVCAYVSTSYGNTDVTDEIAVYVGSKQCLYSEGSYITFNYVSRENATSNNQWGKGAEAKQLAFYPGCVTTPVSTPYSPTSIPLYAFECTRSSGLRLMDLRTYSVVAELDEDGDPQKYSALTVFAGGSPQEKDVIVLAGKGKFKIFETIPESSGVRSISYSGAAPSYFGINGQKYDEPQQGLNIVVDGNETKKIVVK